MTLAEQTRRWHHCHSTTALICSVSPFHKRMIIDSCDELIQGVHNEALFSCKRFIVVKQKQQILKQWALSVVLHLKYPPRWMIKQHFCNAAPSCFCQAKQLWLATAHRGVMALKAVSKLFLLIYKFWSVWSGKKVCDYYQLDINKTENNEAMQKLKSKIETELKVARHYFNLICSFVK